MEINLLLAVSKRGFIMLKIINVINGFVIGVIGIVFLYIIKLVDCQLQAIVDQIRIFTSLDIHYCFIQKIYSF